MIIQIPGIIWLHVRVEAEPVSLVVTTFAVTRGGIPRFTIHDWYTGFQRASEQTQAERENTEFLWLLEIDEAVCRLAGSWIFPVCLSVRPSVRSFVRSSG